MSIEMTEHVSVSRLVGMSVSRLVGMSVNRNDRTSKCQ